MPASRKPPTDHAPRAARRARAALFAGALPAARGSEHRQGEQRDRQRAAVLFGQHLVQQDRSAARQRAKGAAGEGAASYVRKLTSKPAVQNDQITAAVRKATDILNRETGANPYLLHEKLCETMAKGVGIVR